MAEPDLPKHKLLVKLLKMTTSTNDGEALTAMRKANELLTAAGWAWERLLAGKIVVVGDPFATLDTPPARKNDGHGTPVPPSRPKPNPARATPPWPAQAPPRAARPQDAFATPRAASRPKTKISTRANLYPGPCWCCGTNVEVDKGFVFDLSNFTAKSGWKVACPVCNDRGVVPPVAAPRKRRPIDSPLADVSLSDL